MSLVFGTDPEFFLQDDRGNFKSAIGVVNGTKISKIDLGNDNKLFYDNVLAEVNIKPGNNAEACVENISRCLTKMAKTISPYRLLLQASATMPAAECKHPDAVVFGCEPEFCAYEMSIVQAPECKTTFRSAGGHIHLGFAEEKYPLMAPDDDGGVARAWGRVWVVRMMDLFMGIPSLWMDQDPHSPARRRLYGKAGTHRPKDEYGVEYRATSNFWLRSPNMVRLTYNISDFVVNFVGNKGHEKLWEDENSCTGYDVNAMRNAINESNKKAASAFLNGVVKKYMPAVLYTQVLAAAEPVNHLQTFYKEWNL